MPNVSERYIASHHYGSSVNKAKNRIYEPLAERQYPEESDLQTDPDFITHPHILSSITVLPQAYVCLVIDLVSSMADHANNNAHRPWCDVYVETSMYPVKAPRCHGHHAPGHNSRFRDVTYLRAKSKSYLYQQFYPCPYPVQNCQVIFPKQTHAHT
jgi:hypothetical protein